MELHFVGSWLTLMPVNIGKAKFSSDYYIRAYMGVKNIIEKRRFFFSGFTPK